LREKLFPPHLLFTPPRSPKGRGVLLSPLWKWREVDTERNPFYLGGVKGGGLQYYFISIGTEKGEKLFTVNKKELSKLRIYGGENPPLQGVE
jgi:hypothetical protein